MPKMIYSFCFKMSAHDLFRTEWYLLKLWGYVEVRYICSYDISFSTYKTWDLDTHL